MRSFLLDGPIQRQMLLLKLLHAMRNRPEFGVDYVNDPDSPVRLWLSQVRAIMDRVSISKSFEFESQINSALRYWTHSMRLLQISVNDAIEELKLELELYQDEQIGKIYDSSEGHTLKADLLGIIESAECEVFIVDPYLDANIFSLLFENNAAFSIRALCSNYFDAVAKYAQSFSAHHFRKVDVRKCKVLHDRVMFIDEDCWIIGASFKDAGVKPTYLLPLTPALSAEKKRIYDDLWASA